MTTVLEGRVRKQNRHEWRPETGTGESRRPGGPAERDPEDRGAAPEERPVRVGGGAPEESRVRRAVSGVIGDVLAIYGYRDATYPLIAGMAGVKAADLRRVFPSKAHCMLAALQVPSARALGAGSLGLPGREIVRRYLEFWEAGENRRILCSLYRASLVDKRLAAAIERTIIATLIRPFAQDGGLIDAYPRARLACSQLMGLAVSRYVVGEQPLASADHETIADWAGPSLDYFLRGRLGYAYAPAA